MPDEQIRIQDKRRGRFMVDDVILNGYGKKLGPFGISFYVCLCRFSSRKDQSCYPSYRKIQEQTGMGKRQCTKEAKKLEKLHLISRKRLRGGVSIYTLLEPR